jgi:hypothetical protein
MLVNIKVNIYKKDILRVSKCSKYSTYIVISKE